MKHEIIDRFRGCIYGQAIGDALGLGTEFMTDEDIAWKYPDGLQHYNQIFQDRHRKRWKIGDWTDDTDMLLCITDAVIEDKGVNFLNIAKHFKVWGRTRQTLWGAVQMLTQKHVAKRYIISQKVVPLHHETERRYKYV